MSWSSTSRRGRHRAIRDLDREAERTVVAVLARPEVLPDQLELLDVVTGLAEADHPQLGRGEVDPDGLSRRDRDVARHPQCARRLAEEQRTLLTHHQVADHRHRRGRTAGEAAARIAQHQTVVGEGADRGQRAGLDPDLVVGEVVGAGGPLDRHRTGVGHRPGERAEAGQRSGRRLGGPGLRDQQAVEERDRTVVDQCLLGLDRKRRAAGIETAGSRRILPMHRRVSKPHRRGHRAYCRSRLCRRIRGQRGVPTEQDAVQQVENHAAETAQGQVFERQLEGSQVGEERFRYQQGVTGHGVAVASTAVPVASVGLVVDPAGEALVGDAVGVVVEASVGDVTTVENAVAVAVGRTVVDVAAVEAAVRVAVQRNVARSGGCRRRGRPRIVRDLQASRYPLALVVHGI